jgi:UDP-glucose:(heptosyl)LPS alpha-1,3-glucosyltransferase
VQPLVLCAEIIDPLPEGCQSVILPVSGSGNHSRMRSFERAVCSYLQKNPADAVLGFARMKHLDLYFAADDCLLTRWCNKFLNKLLPRRRTFLALEKSALQSPVVLSLTARQERDYQYYYPVKKDSFHRMPPGIDRKYQTFHHQAELRKKVCREFDIDENKFIIVQAAASFRTKGVDRTLSIINALPENLKKRVTFIAAGDDRRREKYARLAEMLKLDVRFPGGSDKLEELYAAADLMIHPARNEAAGAVLLESLACGTPVLCSANCGFAPMVKESGSLVLPRLFRQKILNRTLLVTLSTPGKLADLQSEAENYGRNGDFYRRAERAVDIITGKEK